MDPDMITALHTEMAKVKEEAEMEQLVLKSMWDEKVKKHLKMVGEWGKNETEIVDDKNKKQLKRERQRKERSDKGVPRSTFTPDPVIAAMIARKELKKE